MLAPKTGDSKKEKEGVGYIDYSNCNEGYIIANYCGDNPKVKLQIRTPRDNIYTYTLNSGDEVFPLTEGNGVYICTMYLNKEGKSYSAAISVEINVTLNDELKPFLYPNQYVWFTEETKCVRQGEKIASVCESEIEVVTGVYKYVIGHLKYDYDKAETVQSGYTPDVDTILDCKKGICFDYSAVMATMLRSQGIPTKMDVGWAGDVYHAWVSVYLSDRGWVNGVIQFDGNEWHMMDPTFAENDLKNSSISFIDDDDNYQLKYKY
ncbi:MAG: transglutaminase-like domain-containing protein [Oscillospiraceae bacterium]|nr:transglutaminase-like domain-containing protein [Oscillospiraceae bacterium]